MLSLSPVLGLLIGVIVNLLADSLPISRTVERSRCQSCGAPRPAPAWSALLGLLRRGGRCAYCGQRRRVRDLLVELTAMGASVAVVLENPSTASALPGLLVIFVFLLITVIDIEHRLILHAVTFPSGLVFFLLAGVQEDLTYARSLIGGAFAFLLFLGLYLLGAQFSRWMARSRGLESDEVAFGFGDVTLATVIGLLLGFPAVIEALVRGILYAGLFSVAYLVVLKLQRRDSAFIPIPYGPFLILGALWVYFQGWTTLERLVGMG